MKNKKTILVSGSLVYDRIMDFPGYFKDHIMPDKIHILNVSFAVNNMRESFGGTAGNIAYNLSLLGERPTILSAVGNDFGAYKKWLVKNRADCSQIKIVKDKNTASCYITTDMSDNQITAFNPGAMVAENFLALRASSFIRRVGDYFAIIAPGNNKDMENYAEFYKKNEIKYIFDPGQAITSIKNKALKQCISGAEVLIGNDYEIGLIMKNTGWTIDNLIAKVGMLVVTMGEKGSKIYPVKSRLSGGAQGAFNRVNIKAVKVKKCVDPTGAGDAYRAGLIKGMVLGYDVKKSGQLASVVASFAVEKHGTQEHRFGRKDIEERYCKNYKEKL